MGGKKQWISVDPVGHCLAEYTLYDAYLAGVDKAVWVLQATDVPYFSATIGRRIANKMQVRYVVQPSPEQYGFASDSKPLGTGHALLCAMQAIDQSFILVNADDYYGRNAIASAVSCAQNNECGCVAYSVGQTVKKGMEHRALLHKTSSGGVGLCECTLWRGADGTLFAKDDTCVKEVAEDTLAAMNLFALQPSISTSATRCFAAFLQEGKQEECRLSDVLDDYTGRTQLPLRLLPTTDKWAGLTYREDVAKMRRFLAAKVPDEYPQWLWR